MGLFSRRKTAATRAGLTIREAERRDLGAICRHLEMLVADRIPRRQRPRYLKALREEQAALLADPDAAWFVVERDDLVVGCARVTVRGEHPLLVYLDRKRCGYLFGVFVDPAARRAGAGRMLVERCEAWLVDKGVRWMFLHAEPGAYRFYESLGYEPSLELAKKL